MLRPSDWISIWNIRPGRQAGMLQGACGDNQVLAFWRLIKTIRIWASLMDPHLSARRRLLPKLVNWQRQWFELLSDGLGAPGWQAGGDLERLKIREDGVLVCPELMKECLLGGSQNTGNGWGLVKCGVFSWQSEMEDSWINLDVDFDDLNSDLHLTIRFGLH